MTMILSRCLLEDWTSITLGRSDIRKEEQQFGISVASILVVRPRSIWMGQHSGAFSRVDHPGLSSFLAQRTKRAFLIHRSRPWLRIWSPGPLIAPSLLQLETGIGKS